MVGAQTPLKLNTLYRVVVPKSDRMTTIGSGERTRFRMEGQEFYVPAAKGSGRAALFRLRNFRSTDHADSTASIPRYLIEETLGFPWSSLDAVPGLSPMYEAFDRATGDNALTRSSESLPGYVPKPLGVYAYGRYGNANESLISLSAGGVTIESNEVAGGSLWRWYWAGLQFVNIHDYGREIQSALCIGDCLDNPTEAGDTFSGPRIPPGVRHGSPLIVAENSGVTQMTRAVPLEWDPRMRGGDVDHPVIWPRVVIGKDITLDFNGMGSVAQYTTHLTLPAPVTGALEMPTPYLRATFTRFWTYDAPADVLTEVTDSVPDGCVAGDRYFFSPEFGGVIASDASGAYAMGEYGMLTSQGGSVSYFAIEKLLCRRDGSSERASDSVKLDAVNVSTYPVGDSMYTAYLMTDSVANVASKMKELFQSRAQRTAATW